MNRRSFIARCVGAIAAASVMFKVKSIDSSTDAEIMAEVFHRPVETQVAFSSYSAYFNKVLADDIHRYAEAFEDLEAKHGLPDFDPLEYQHLMRFV